MINQSQLSLIETRQRLKYWAYWCNDILAMGLGYSHKNIIARLMESKGDVIKSTNTHLAPESTQSEEIDELINNYAKQYLQQTQVLTLHYLHPGKVKEKVALAKISRSTYFYYLQHAETWIRNQLFPENIKNS